MKRAALAVVVLVAVIAAILLLLRGGDDASIDVARGSPRDRPSDGPHDIARDVATGTAARPAPQRLRHASETPTEANPTAPPVASRIEGTVVESPGKKPLADADVLVSRRRASPPPVGAVDFERPGEPEFRTKSAADGTFGVDVPDAGPWIVVARAADHADATKTGDVRAPIRLELVAVVEFVVTVVRDKDEAPIPGAEVWTFEADYKGVPQSVVVADELGVVHVRIAPKDLAFVVCAKGFAPMFASSVSAGGKFRLSPGYVVAGVVRDRAGRGIAGAVLRTPGADRRAWLSDADGKFVLDDTLTWNGVIPVAATADGFAPWIGSLVSGETDAVIELARMVSVSGVVLMPDGKPALGAEVSGFRADATGAFRLSLGSGPQAIWAEWKPAKGGALDALSGVARFEVPDGGTLDRVEIRLGPTWKSFVVVRVVDGAGNAVTDIQAQLDYGAAVREVRGDVVVFGARVPPGSTIDVALGDWRKEGMRWSETRTSVTTQPSAEAPPTEIHLAPRREFTVDVRGPDGSDLPKSVKTVDLTLGEDAWYRRVARVREDRASATWTVDPTRRHVLTVAAKEFAAIRREVSPEELSAGRMEVRLDAGVSVRGRIVSTDPRATAGAFLGLRSTAAPPGGRADAVREGDGSFRFEHVASGAWRLSVRWPQSVVAEREIHVEAGKDFDVGDIVVPPSATLRGVVRRPDGSPCGGATVQFLLGEDDASTNALVVTHEDGAFETDVPAVGRGALLVRRPELGAVVVRLDGADLTKPFAVRLAPEGKIDVRIREPRPLPPSCGISLRTPDGAVRWRPNALPSMDDKLGYDMRYVLSGLAPGPVVVAIECGPSTYTATVDVVAGATTPVVVGPDK